MPDETTVAKKQEEEPSKTDLKNDIDRRSGPVDVLSMKQQLQINFSHLSDLEVKLKVTSYQKENGIEKSMRIRLRLKKSPAELKI